MITRPLVLFATFLTAGAGVLAWLPAEEAEPAAPIKLQTRFRVAVPDDGGDVRILYKSLEWDPHKTAIVVCDMWDRHWCAGATSRVAEMAPRMNRFLSAARDRGVLIVHAPSSCMEAYRDHPARRRAQQARQDNLPEFLKGWNQRLPAEEGATWPVDQSDGGCDCSPKCAGGSPWRRQIDTLEIDEADAISDAGLEIGGLLTQRGIENVMLLGVHTNMCVIGRPFGLRNMVRLGKNVVLVRDLTDTMYNSRQAPLVPHVRGTELVINYIERFVCPTITSSSWLGGPAFRFRQDDRPHVAFIVSDDHYDADKTLPVFAERLRERYGCYCTLIHGEGSNHFPHMDELQKADLAVLYVRRLALPQQQLVQFRDFLHRGKPLVALRTASHAFAIHEQTPEGCAQWPEFDAEVLGGNYHGHGRNTAGSDIANVPEQAGHPVLAGVQPATWHSTGSLYSTSPIATDATLLMTGSIETGTEPVTWIRNHGQSRILYTALGHPDDFDQPAFIRLLSNAIFWALDKPLPKER